jgi:hypothetical protein
MPSSTGFGSNTVLVLFPINLSSNRKTSSKESSRSYAALEVPDLLVFLGKFEVSDFFTFFFMSIIFYTSIKSKFSLNQFGWILVEFSKLIMKSI